MPTRRQAATATGLVIDTQAQVGSPQLPRSAGSGPPPRFAVASTNSPPRRRSAS